MRRQETSLRHGCLKKDCARASCGIDQSWLHSTKELFFWMPMAGFSVATRAPNGFLDSPRMKLWTARTLIQDGSRFLKTAHLSHRRTIQSPSRCVLVNPVQMWSWESTNLMAL